MAAPDPTGGTQHRKNNNKPCQNTDNNNPTGKPNSTI